MHHATVQYNSTVHVTAVSIIHLCHTAVLYNYKSELYYTTLQLHNKSALLAVSWVTARITHLYCSVGVAIIQIGVAIAQRHNRIALYHTNTSCSFTIPLYHTFTLYEIQLNCTTQLNNCTVLELQLHHNHTLLYHTCNCVSRNCTREMHTVIITVLYHELQLYILCSDTSTIQQQCIVSCTCTMELCWTAWVAALSYTPICTMQQRTPLNVQAIQPHHITHKFELHHTNIQAAIVQLYHAYNFKLSYCRVILVVVFQQAHHTAVKYNLHIITVPLPLYHCYQYHIIVTHNCNLV